MTETLDLAREARSFECEDCGRAFRSRRGVPTCAACGSLFVVPDLDVPLWGTWDDVA